MENPTRVSPGGIFSVHVAIGASVAHTSQPAHDGPPQGGSTQRLHHNRCMTGRQQRPYRTRHDRRRTARQGWVDAVRTSRLGHNGVDCCTHVKAGVRRRVGHCVHVTADARRRVQGGSTLSHDGASCVGRRCAHATAEARRRVKNAVTQHAPWSVHSGPSGVAPCCAQRHGRLATLPRH